ncbi:MAG: GGDEF domain-containing protein [Burkholderiales bacterium]|nr:GGDEF domain-containing protein [Burkholderiales bacterium]
MSPAIYRVLQALLVPAFILGLAYAAITFGSALPDSLAGLRVHGAVIALTLSIAVSIAFGRGRVVFALLSLALAYAAYRHFPLADLAGPAARIVFAALCLFVPVNLALMALLPERGALTGPAMRRLALIAAQAALTVGLIYIGGNDVATWLYRPLLPGALTINSPIPQAGQAALLLALLTCTTAWLITRSAINLGLASAIVAFALAAHGLANPDQFAFFTAGGALILIVAVLQDTFRMAFRDELTGLPSRRALNESLAAVSGRYAIAMVDVDHFKKFNDTHGHDTGDQVLKMVASRLAHCGGGGKTYRYGGEEFTLLFPGKSLDQALPYLESLCQDIAGYRMAVRSPDRPERTGPGKKNRGVKRADKTVAVTISIGVAEKNGKLATPDDVIQAADKALYRAKNKGRNRVCR